MSGGPRDLTARMGAGAAQVEVVDGSSVVGPAFQGPLAQKLARDDIQMADIAAGQCHAPFQVGGG